MLPSDMNLQIGKIENYNNKIRISLPSFKIGTNVNINLDEDKPDAKPKNLPAIESNKEHKQDVKPNMELKKEDQQELKMIKTEPGMGKITYEEEKVALRKGRGGS